MFDFLAQQSFVNPILPPWLPKGKKKCVPAHGIMLASCVPRQSPMIGHLKDFASVFQ